MADWGFTGTAPVATHLAELEADARWLGRVVCRLCRQCHDNADSLWCSGCLAKARTAS